MRRPATKPATKPATAAFVRGLLRLAASLLVCVSVVGSATAGETGAARRSAVKKTAKSAQKKSPVRAPVDATVPDYAHRQDVADYIDERVAQDRFDRDDLTRLFADVRYSPTAARLMMPSATTGARRDWNAYRARFVEPVRLAAGYRFWEDNAALLARAEQEFGVPAEIIVGILGVETVYGRNTGSFRVVDALATLAFDYPNKQRDRSGFFRDQLTDVLMMTRERGVDPTSLRGSYAGAIGMPQFMPGSIRHFAIDYDGDGRIDLVDSPADIIGSVANFLAQHGWVRDQPTYLPLGGRSTIDAAQQASLDTMVDAGSVPTLSYAQLNAAGLVTQAAVVEPLALIDLPSGTDAAGRPLFTYLAGTQNFHVITRYNRSYFYAFSVIELGSTIRALRDVKP